MEFITIVTLIAGFMLGIVVALLLTKLIRTEDDYLRMGCRASWWMVGLKT